MELDEIIIESEGLNRLLENESLIDMVIENGDGTLTLRSKRGVFPSRVEHGGITYVLQETSGDEARYRPPWDPSAGGC